MRKIFFIFSFTGALLALTGSCKKSQPSNGNYYIKFKLNDSLITWADVSGEIAMDLIDSTKTDFTLEAASNDTSEVLSLSIEVGGNGIVPRTYQSSDSAADLVADFYTGFDSQAEEEFEIINAYGMPASVLTITITSVTPQQIRGTFTGNYLADLFSGNTVIITDGEFFVPRL
jgi:hypothetical protein